MKKIFTFIGVIANVIAIIDCIYSIIKENRIILTPLLVICICLILFSIFIIIVISNKYYRYSIKKIFSYYFTVHPHLSYYIKERDVVYTYKSRTELKDRIRVLLVSKVDGLTHFKGKFRWSKPQELKEFDVKCISTYTKFDLGRDTTWYTYNVEFEAPPKGGEREVEVLIDNLNDPECVALPYYSFCITEKTKHLKLTIALEGKEKFNLDKVKFSIYDNGASSSPVWEEEYSLTKELRFIRFDQKKMELTIEEKFPIYGYKYQLSWDFV